MAETVLSMARSLLGSAVSKAGSVAANEMSLLLGVRKEIWFIKDELKTIQAFLVVAETMEKKDLLLKVWVEQVRDLSYDVEDCFDEFKVHVGSQSLLQQLMKLKDRHRIADQIRNLKSRVEEVSNRNTRYSLIKKEFPSTSDDKDSFMEDIRNLSGSNIDEADLVGFDKPKKELLQMIDVNANDGHTRVICVVGMGGLGKTTLVRKTYESKEDIAKNFPYRAWITVSQSFLRFELLKKIIIELFGYDSLKKLEGKAMLDHADDLRKQLKEKRYFIVLDDLWTIDAWKWISDMAFPSNNNKGSRIIITTRDVGLAKQCTSSESLIYHIEPLQIRDAEDLLLRKTKKEQADINGGDMRIVTQLVKKCGCLPLAILTIGGILASKKVADWGKFYTELPSELEVNPSLDALRSMVTLSYNNLPSYLKPCFLYLSIFPEDFEIQRRRLVDRWIAEGFVRARVGMTIQNVGESYFYELINRSMILPSRVSIEGNHVKSCRVHDIMHDIIVSFSGEESFVSSIQGNGSNVAEENFRHVACHGSKCPKAGMEWSHIRSLTFFLEGTVDRIPLVCSPKLRMLRVLDLVGYIFIITQDDINNIMLLYHLKYLNVETYNSLIYSIPRSIGKIEGLQILDIENSFITTLPTEITKLQSLRSIRCFRKGFTYFDLGVRVPRGIGNLKELQILRVVDIRKTSSKAIEEIGELTRLRKLVVGTQGAAQKKCNTFSASIQKLSSLRSLSVIADIHQDNGGLRWLVSSSAPPPHLRSLRFQGYIGEMTDWFRSLTQLVKVYFDASQLKEDKTMEVLGALPKLMRLTLVMDSYLEKELVFRQGAFLNLRNLVIRAMNQLRGIRFEEGASPQMENIEIMDCRLESGINGIKHLPKLKEILLGYKSKVARLGTLQEEVGSHPNQPVLRLKEDRSDHDLGDVGGSEVQVEATESIPDQAREGSQAIMLTTSDS